jgi:ATP-dependent Lon protease
MKKDKKKHNTRSKTNVNICKINKGDNDDDDIESIASDNNSIIIENKKQKKENKENNEYNQDNEDNNIVNDESNKDNEDNEDNENNEDNLKRKFTEMLDNNTIIILNNNNKKFKSLSLLDKNNDEEYDEYEEYDDDYEETHEKIKKNRKYIDKNPNFSNYKDEEMEYFLKQSVRNKNKIIKFEKKTNELNKEQVPLRFKIINSDINDSIKAVALKKLNHLSSMNERSGEYFKILNYVENLCKIPCGIYKKLKIPKDKSLISNFLLKSHKILDQNVYGHDKSKEQITRIIGQWISNPSLKGNCIGIHGSPGCGKTRLIKEGLCKALDLPFVFIPLGGINDSAYLTGHSFTYEGAIHGKIVDALMKAGCMNPIIYFDELDKVSDSSRGEEIINTLIHLTDSTQNDAFFDKYFYDIPLNLSKALIIFTYNNDYMINPILRDRMIRINTEPYKNKDKINIANKFLIPEILKDFNFKDTDLIFTEGIIKYIISKTESENGVRNLRRSIECIISNLNLFRLMDNKIEDKSLSISNLNIDFEIPFVINNKVVDYLIKNKNTMSDSIAHIYT